MLLCEYITTGNSSTPLYMVWSPKVKLTDLITTSWICKGAIDIPMVLIACHCLKLLMETCILLKNLNHYNRSRVLGCKPVDGVLVVLRLNQLNNHTFVHQMGCMCVSHLVTKVAIFIWFELRTTITPSTGSHPSTVGLWYWPKFLSY